MNDAGARVVVGLTGATGAVYAVRLLERLRESGCETHLVASPAGVLNVHHEIGLDRKRSQKNRCRETMRSFFPDEEAEAPEHHLR